MFRSGSFANLFLGQVVFAAGGFVAPGILVKQVELYSPNGKCQHVLASLPVPVNGLFLVLFNASIVACSGYQNKVIADEVLMKKETTL